MKFLHIFFSTACFMALVGLGFGQEVQMSEPKNIVGDSELEVKVVDQNCWVEVYEDTDFDVNDPYLRIRGPFEAGSLEALAGQEWSDEIESVIVGPSATVFAFGFSGTEVTFVANHKIGDLAELDMSDDIESIKVQCNL